MKKEYFQIIVCPECHGDLSLCDEKLDSQKNVESGKLMCIKCQAAFSIIDSIPRFVTKEG